MKEYCQNLLQEMVGSYAKFHDGQWEAIDSALNNKRTLVVQRTGWGKSVVYFIASKILNETRGGVTILISPLLSLMRNQIEAAKKIGVRAVTVNSENEKEWSEIEAILTNGLCDIILIAPERLANKDFMNRFIPAIKGGPNMIVIDEAHCISDWGHDFRPNYSRIVDVLQTLPPNIPVIATTATANDRVVKDIKRQLGNNISLIKGPLMRESLNIQVIKLGTQARRMAWILENINKFDGSGIIYCSTTRDCNILAEWLQANGVNALPYHGKLSSNNDEKRLLREERERLLIENEVKVLVSTVALGMGFDKGDISFVIHYQTPGNIIRYYQEIGRAGRKLLNAYAILLVGEEDREINEYFIKSSFPKREELEEILHLIENSPLGLSTNELGALVNMTNKSIGKCIQLLELHGIVVKNGSKYTRTLNEYEYSNFRVEEILETRYRELDFMDKYINTNECYMKCIANELDDTTCDNCGKCCNCIRKKHFQEAVSEVNIRKAEDFIKGRLIKIKVKKKWPAGVVASTGKYISKGELNEVGRVLSNYGDSGWGKIVAEDKYTNNYFRDELVDATVNLIINSWQEADKLDYVAAVPSLRRPKLVKDFAERVAQKLNIQFIDVIQKPSETPEQKTMENSNMQCKNAYSGFVVNRGINSGNVLLVDDMVDSGWTLTVCGSLLKRNGATKVFPYALASTAKNGGDE